MTTSSPPGATPEVRLSAELWSALLTAAQAGLADLLDSVETPDGELAYYNFGSNEDAHRFHEYVTEAISVIRATLAALAADQEATS